MAKTFFKVNKILPIVIAVIFAFLSVFLTISSSPSNAQDSNVTSAQIIDRAAAKYEERLAQLDEETRKKLEVPGDRLSTFMNIYQYFSKKNKDNDSFDLIFERILTPGVYIRYTPKAVKAEWFQGSSGLKDQCANPPPEPSLVWHNCDIPSLFTQIFQDVYLFIGEYGLDNSYKSRAALPSSEFGLPTFIPGNVVEEGKAAIVPIDPADRHAKYTGLELFGYNLRYSKYYGEWDHIETLSKARFLGNYGLSGSIRVTASILSESFNSAAVYAAETVSPIASAGQSFTTGNIAGAAGYLLQAKDAVFQNHLGKIADASIKGALEILLDTSDYNIVSTDSWYRTKYGATLYNARELSQDELGVLLRYRILEYLNTQEKKNGNTTKQVQQEAINNLPAEDKFFLTDVYSSPPSEPLPAGGRCSRWYPTDVAGETGGYYEDISEPVYSESDCVDRFPGVDKKDIRFVPDAFEAEDATTWINKNKNWYDKAVAAKMIEACPLNSQATAEEFVLEYANFTPCYLRAYDTRRLEVQERTLAGASEEILQNSGANESTIEEYRSIKLDAPNYYKWVHQNKLTDEEVSRRNMFAAYNRYVCVNKDSDLRPKSNVAEYQFLYNSKGQRNPQCKPVRLPIQDGLYGNGYFKDYKYTNLDTRHVHAVTDINYRDKIPSYGSHLLMNFNGIGSIEDSVGNLEDSLLRLTAIIVRTMNTLQNFAYSPVLSTIGVDKMVASILETLRDGFFLPLSPIIVSVSVFVLIKDGSKRRSLKSLLKELWRMFGVLVLAVVILHDPATTVRLTETIPAFLESRAGALALEATPSSKNALCGTTERARTDSVGLEFDTGDASRRALCIGWNAFLFQPWVHGQWGTSWDNLDDNKIKIGPKTRELVGSPTVNMGAGYIYNNWALYQLQESLSGTSNSPDLAKPAGSSATNLYRIVDWQAGVKTDGLQRDSKYFEAWTGIRGNRRLRIATASVILSVLGLVTIGIIAIVKIQISLLMTIMLLLSPVYFLFAMNRNLGRKPLEAYLFRLAGYAIQRVVLVTLLALYMAFVDNVMTTSTSYLEPAILVAIVSILFLEFRGKLVDKAMDILPKSNKMPNHVSFIGGASAWANPTYDIETAMLDKYRKKHQNIRHPGVNAVQYALKEAEEYHHYNKKYNLTESPVRSGVLEGVLGKTNSAISTARSTKSKTISALTPKSSKRGLSSDFISTFNPFSNRHVAKGSGRKDNPNDRR